VFPKKIAVMLAIIACAVLNAASATIVCNNSPTVEAEIIHTVFVISGSVTISLGPTAPVTVETPPLPQPFLVLTKMVDKTYAVSGAYLNYTLLYLNSGNGDATEVKVFESIPPDTHYISGSAIADGMNIQFSPDGGLNYYNQETTPITDLKFELGSSLPAGQGGSIIFKVEVK